MARDIDTLIEYVRSSSLFTPVITQVLINRLDPMPTSEEYEIAKRQLLDGTEPDPWEPR